MNYLELCQGVARESGTVASIPAPSTVTGQSGRLSRIVHWVNDSYRLIQAKHPDWQWMRGTFSGSLLTGTREYDGAALNATRFSRFARGGRASSVASVYDPALGVDDEGVLIYYHYPAFYEAFLIGPGSDTTGKPTHVTITPAGEIAVYPLPDKTYTIRGMYHKSAQTLTADADEPEMPEDYHLAIQYRALMMLGTFDEGAPQLGIWEAEYRALMERLEAEWLPPMRVEGPLA